MPIGKINRLQPILSQSTTRVASQVIRTISRTSQLCASHYDVLEITPKATQGDIKTAYYKLSKVYHPDKSEDEASAKKFRAITEAYEVLGNVKLKKMYDRGLLTGTENTSRMHYEPEPEPTDPTLRFYKSRANRQVTPTIDGKTPIYNFDAWSREHYGNIFEKTKYEKELLRKKKQKVVDIQSTNRQEAILYIIFALGGLFIMMVLKGQDDYDMDMLRKKKAEVEEKLSEK